MAKKRIAVLFGGASADHAASLHTAYSVLSAMPKEIEPLAIGITRPQEMASRQEMPSASMAALWT